MENTAKIKLKLQDFLPYRLAILSNRISRAIADLYEEEFGITLPEWRVIAVLGDTANVSAGIVGNNTAMDKVAVSRAVNKLIDNGLVLRSFSNEDKRRSVLSLSKEGRAVYEKVAPIALDYENRLLQPFSAEEQIQLERLLNKLDDVQPNT